MVRARPVSMLYIHIEMVIMVTILYLHNFNGLERTVFPHRRRSAPHWLLLWPVYDNYVHDIVCTLVRHRFHIRTVKWLRLLKKGEISQKIF